MADYFDPRPGDGRMMKAWECAYCTSENQAVRETYFDQKCPGCVKRMGESSQEHAQK